MLTAVSTLYRYNYNGILVFIDLDIASLARGFGLLHLPSMPELKGRTFPQFIQTDMDYDAIPFL